MSGFQEQIGRSFQKNICDYAGRVEELCTRKKVDVLSHTRLQPGDRNISLEGNRLNGFQVLASRSSPG